MKPKIGFMGLGIMGGPMAANILKAGYPLLVYNRTPEKAQPLAQAGAEVAATPKALAQAADVIIVMVTGPEALHELLWGAHGAAEELNSPKAFINMSSVSPYYTRAMAQRLAPSGVNFVDAPVSGSKKPAEDATLLILAGGAPGQVAAVTPILQTMGKKVIYCGEAGQGSMMKMMVNLLLGAMMEGLAEALNFGKLGGLDLEAMLDVIFSGPLNCGLYQMKADMFRHNAFPVAFPLKHMTKDFKFVVDTAYQTGAPAPVAHQLLHLYRLGLSHGLGDQDFAAIYQVLNGLVKP
ncbi:MAG: NAD(P)-dependent oxidoreductase [Deltaproteobacteria bacterium]|nr:NAD(P)-dependent oxidoreductase [Deltaproteobacteria bacterium]